MGAHQVGMLWKRGEASASRLAYPPRKDFMNGAEEGK